MRIDLHTHSTISDGTDTPAELIIKASQAKLDVIALTDHDTMDGVATAQHVGARVGVHVLPGIEVSTKHEGTSIHLLGYGLEKPSAGLQTEIDEMLESRRTRTAKMVARLNELGINVSMDAIDQIAGAGTIGRPHIADAMIAAGYVADRTEAFEKYLASGRPAYVPRYSVDLARAIDLVHESGGAAVIAHLGIRGGLEAVTPRVVSKLVHDHGLDGIEVDYPLHDAAMRDMLHELGARLGLIRTGSSDCHGTGKVNHDLGCETTRPTAYEALMERVSVYR